LSNLSSNNRTATPEEFDLVGAYSNSEEMEISGTSQGFRDLANALINNTAPKIEFTFKTSSSSRLAPYGHFYKTLQIIRKENAAVEIKREDEILVICGSLENIEILAEIILMLAGQTKNGYHLHIEYLPTNYPEFPNYLAPTSEPIVMTIESETIT
jgi:hypothetical protein